MADLRCVDVDGCFRPSLHNGERFTPALFRQKQGLSVLLIFCAMRPANFMEGGLHDARPRRSVVNAAPSNGAR
ncbi:MAG: hypothetical protein ACRCS9_14415 [Hyphomicrobium sp.]